MGYKITQGNGLIDQIQSSNNTSYTELTEKTIKKFMRDLMLKDTEQPRDKITGRFLKGQRISKPREFIYMLTEEQIKRFDEAIKTEMK